MPKKHPSRADLNNPNNDAYWQARGLPSRPSDWKLRVSREERREPSRRCRGPDDGLGDFGVPAYMMSKDDY